MGEIKYREVLLEINKYAIGFTNQPLIKEVPQTISPLVNLKISAIKELKGKKFFRKRFIKI